MENSLQYFSEKQYPGRGIVQGLSPDSKHIVQIYWLMGRSENSKNRVFVKEGDCVRTKAYDENKLTDPSLIIYYPVRISAGKHIVSNGAHTDVIARHFESNLSFERALSEQLPEPDAPNYTPRISAAANVQGNILLQMGIVGTVNNDFNKVHRASYNITNPIPGEGMCIHTYSANGNPLPPFSKTPHIMPLKDDCAKNAEMYWGALHPEYKVSLLAKHININSGEYEMVIINKLG